jgi:hypothetical protein
VITALTQVIVKLNTDIMSYHFPPVIGPVKDLIHGFWHKAKPSGFHIFTRFQYVFFANFGWCCSASTGAGAGTGIAAGAGTGDGTLTGDASSAKGSFIK